MKPFFLNNYVAVAMSSSEEYLPYLSVCLQSLVDNSSIENNYDIIIFSDSKSKSKKEMIINEFSKNNISVRFYNPSKFFENINLNITHSYFNKACYYRIAAPVIFKDYEKII